MELEWEKIGRFGRRFYRTPIQGGWLVQRQSRLAFIEDPEHLWPGGLAWTKMPSTHGMRAQVFKGWLLWWQGGLQYVRDESLQWTGLWESLHNRVCRSAIPGGWLVLNRGYGPAAFIEDTEHRWNGSNAQPSLQLEPGDGRLSLPSQTGR